MRFLEDKRGKKMNRRGELLVENVIFIILNLAFLSIIVLFIIQQGSSVGELEEVYAKKTALVIDSAKAPMKIKVDMKKGLEKARENGVNPSEIVSIKDNNVIVSLSNETSTSYHFFNEVEVSAYPDEDQNKYTGLYIIFVKEK